MVLIFADEPIRDGIYTGARIRGVKSAEVARGLLSDFVPDCMIIHLFLVGWVMYFFVRFLCRFYLTNTGEHFLTTSKFAGKTCGKRGMSPDIPP